MCCYAIFENKMHINIVGLISIIMAMRVVEKLLWWLVVDANNYIIFGSYFLIDLPVILLVAFRAPLSRFIEFKRFGEFDAQRYTITNADLVIGKVYMIYCLINLLALGENALRHLDDFGFDKSADATVWLYNHARVIWSSYEYVKYMLNMIEFIAILSTVSNYMRSPRFLKS
jgi:hypothetical protein